MNAVFRSLACLLVGAAIAQAGPPANVRILVLDNENLLEGEVTRVADGYEVRRATGDLTLPAGRVLIIDFNAAKGGFAFLL